MDQHSRVIASRAPLPLGLFSWMPPGFYRASNQPKPSETKPERTPVPTEGFLRLGVKCGSLSELLLEVFCVCNIPGLCEFVSEFGNSPKVNVFAFEHAAPKKTYSKRHARVFPAQTVQRESSLMRCSAFDSCAGGRRKALPRAGHAALHFPCLSLRHVAMKQAVSSPELPRFAAKKQEVEFQGGTRASFRGSYCVSF